MIGGSGVHTNISIHSGTFQGEKSSKAPTLTPLETVFLQSVLDNLQAICAFSLPTVASYARVADGVWSGGTYVTWGTENREATVRLCGAPGTHRFEIRCVDGTANPYLCLASILAATIHGLDTGKTLSVSSSLDVAATLGEEKREELGIGERKLPLKLEEAREYLEKSEVLRKGLGDNFVTKYLAVNEVCLSPSPGRLLCLAIKRSSDTSRASVEGPKIHGVQRDCRDVLGNDLWQ